MRGVTGNIYAGVHEFNDMMLTVHALRPGDLFVDIGANVGSYSILAAGVSGATTWAFEPDPVTIGYLARNVALNDLGARVTIFEYALGDTDGEVSFTIGLDTNNKVLADASGGNARRVQQRRLDGLTANAAPFMIKMDTEGHEEFVFLGGQATLACESLRVLIAETVSPQAETMLKERGFMRGYYDPNTRKLSQIPTGLQSVNSLWIRDWEFVQARVASADAVQVLGRRI
jgi:FkbM family methyltransferase